MLHMSNFANTCWVVELGYVINGGLYQHQHSLLVFNISQKWKNQEDGVLWKLIDNKNINYEMGL